MSFHLNVFKMYFKCFKHILCTWDGCVNMYVCTYLGVCVCVCSRACSCKWYILYLHMFVCAHVQPPQALCVMKSSLFVSALVRLHTEPKSLYSHV